MTETNGAIKSLDPHAVHRITAGQVVIDLQTAVKELVENSLDAGATSVEVRFKDYGLESIQVIDNGSGISPGDYPYIALKHHTSKLTAFSDLSTLLTFGFRGEALSSLCALSKDVHITTSTANQGSLGDRIEVDSAGKVTSVSKIARQRGTTVTINHLFKPLPVRRKEFKRNAKREFGKALGLLTAYALIPCVAGSHTARNQASRGTRLIVLNQTDDGRKTTHLSAPPSTSLRATVPALWGPKALENLVDLDVSFSFSLERRIRATTEEDSGLIEAKVKGLISKFETGCGRTGTERQFFYVNGRPCTGSKIQKAFNEVYRSFNANQSPFIVADLLITTTVCDVNVSPDKRSIFLHGEGNLLAALKSALEDSFSQSRSTYDVEPLATQDLRWKLTQTKSQGAKRSKKQSETPGHAADADDNVEFTSGQSQSSGSLVTDRQHLSERSIFPESDDVVAPEVVHLDTQMSPRPSNFPESLDLVASENTFMGGQQSSPPLESSSPAPVAFSISTQAPQSEREDQDIGGPNDGTQEKTPSFDRGSSTANGSAEDISLLKEKLSAIPSGVMPARNIQAVLDTSRAIWNRGSVSRESRGAEPPRKKRRSEAGGGNDYAGEPVGEEMGTATQGTEDESRMQDREDQPKEGNDGTITPVSREKDVQTESCASGSTHAGSVAVDEDVDMEDEEDQLEESPPRRVRIPEPPVRKVNLRQTKLVQVSRSDRCEVRAITARMDQDSEELRARKIISNQAESMEGSQEEQTEDEVTEINELTEDVDANGGRNSAHKRRATDLPDIVDLTGGSLAEPGETDSETAVATYEEFVSRPEVVRSQSGADQSLNFDLSRISNIWRCLGNSTIRDQEDSESATTHDGASPAPLTFKVDDDGATAELSRVINKKDFGAMEIVGQFNHGFIITRRKQTLDAAGLRRGMDDLFIIDQHAADEKYNFETLQQTTKINSQRLLKPQLLELTAADELVAADHLETLKQNGFVVEPVPEADATKPQRHKLQLVARPVSKDTVFGIKDLEELIQLLRDCPRGQTVRCSKARAMFAMRACRKSVMIGTPLTKPRMTTVVRHMGMMKQPWNCPHGRPTMRHLSDITGMRRASVSRRAVDWEVYMRSES